MPEPPDFEQLALDLLCAADCDGPGSVETAALLRQVWNARGAADLASLEAEFEPLRPFVKDPYRAIRRLDR